VVRIQCSIDTYLSRLICSFDFDENAHFLVKTYKIDGVTQALKWVYHRSDKIVLHQILRIDSPNNDSVFLKVWSCGTLRFPRFTHFTETDSCEKARILWEKGKFLDF
jgi:hypothetical protein